MWAGWGSRGARHTRGSGLRFAGITLRGGAMEIGWRLRPGDSPGSLCGVRLRVGGEWHPVQVVPRDDTEDEAPVGTLRVPLPETDPPWSMEGYGPDGPWSEEVSTDPLVLDDYRQSMPVSPSPGSVAERGGVRVVLDRLAARSDRLVVFYTVDVAGAGRYAHQVATPTLSVGGERWQALPPPVSADGPPSERPVRDGVAYFPPQLEVGARADFAVAEVTVREPLALQTRIGIPDTLPAIVEPQMDLPSGHRIEEVVFTRNGLVIRVTGGAAMESSVLFPLLRTDEGRTLLSAGGLSGPSSTVALFGPVPPAARELVLERALIHAEVRGPWRMRFPVPMPL